MTTPDINTMVKTMIEAEIVKALNSAPDAVEKLVKAALSKPVDENGKVDGWGNKMPYLDYLVGNEIRNAATAAVRTVVAEQAPKIEAMVRAGLTSDSVVAAVTNSFVKAAENDWRIIVNFAAKPER